MASQMNEFDTPNWIDDISEGLNDNMLDLAQFQLGINLLPSIEDSMQSTSPESINSINHNMIMNVTQKGPPERTLMENTFNFNVEINSNDTNKKKYLYSYRLNRIYVDMESDFSVLFNWDASALGSSLWVRACVVFADEEQAQKRVERCLQHLHQSNTDVEENIKLNVLHSSRPMRTQGVEYCGDAKAVDSWLSTVVALSKPSPEAVAHAYNGKVYGRRMVGARVCACPRRDMLKDENSEAVFETGKKRVSAKVGQPKSKKIKVETTEAELPAVTTGCEQRELTLPPLEVVGDRIALAGLQTMLLMSEQALELLPNGPQAAKYQESIAKLKQTQAMLDLTEANPGNN